MHRKKEVYGMPRENEAYRDNLEEICKAFPSVKLLSVADVEKFTGRDRRTLVRLFSFRGNYISAATLAREMSTAKS